MKSTPLNTDMQKPAADTYVQIDHTKPESTLACFFNSVFGHTRNWPRAYSCLLPSARVDFGVSRGLQAFADYWDDKLSFLDELVKNRHKEFPYTHRTCFLLDNMEQRELAEDHAIFVVELIENHLARDRFVIVQVKELTRREDGWLLTSGRLDGKLDDIINLRSLRARPAR